MEKVTDPRVRICLDVGHAHAMTLPEYKVLDWIRILGPYITHFHLHNNDGTGDQHRALGDGTLDMKADNTFVLTFNVSVQASVADVSQAAMDQNMQMQGEGTYTQNGSNLSLTLTHGTLTVNGQTSETTQSSTTNATFNGNEIVFENNGVQMVFTR